ncbi:MAG: RsmB/NOP family class I SAM-dependent RNA methyltransferase [Bacteroidetes bacterium]|nr:RsmB/NOP family class I SAM-dependent RNA methyltransferase [Bacteroidota bacterium]
MSQSPRLHKNLVAAVIEALETSFGKGYYADKVIERILKANPKWGVRDRGFIAENTYGMVRWWRLLWELYGKEPSLKRKELYRLFGIWWQWQGNDLPKDKDWTQFDTIRDLDLKDRYEGLKEHVAFRESFPDWLAELMEEELGAKWPEIARASNIPAEVFLRTNTLKIERKALLKELSNEFCPAKALENNEVGIVLEKRKNTFRLRSFQSGFFEVQDGGSQMIAPYLEVKPGMRVIDACSGAGGKALHLAALMENKGQIIAMDVEAWKLKELQKRARRNGVHNIETRPIENAKSIKRLHNSADRLLLDVPCSGTGVIKRNPDTKWKLQPEHLDRVRKIQGDIIADYSKMLKKGGKMVYATCSILRSENEEQVEKFLESNPDFKLLKEQRLDPSQWSDGFYMALVERV